MGGRIGGDSVGGSSVSIGKVSVRGGLDQALVRRGLRARLARLEACREAWAASRDAGTATVAVTFTIGLDGRVTTAASDGDRGLAACTQRVVAEAAFPRPVGDVPVEVAVPIGFRAGP